MGHSAIPRPRYGETVATTVERETGLESATLSVARDEEDEEAR
jgi:hypothetical protein